MRSKLFQPFRLPVRLSLSLAWALIAVAVIVIGSRSLEPNHPLGLLLLGLGLAAPGLLAVLALASQALWDRLIEPGLDVRQARSHLYGIAVLGIGGAVMIGFALSRLL